MSTYHITFTTPRQQGVHYYTSRDAFLTALVDSFGIPASYADLGEYRYFDEFHAEFGPTDEPVLVCRCGCGLMVKREGGFRPGHDAKMVSRLIAEIRAGMTSLAAVREMLADRPKLVAKIARARGV